MLFGSLTAFMLMVFMLIDYYQRQFNPANKEPDVQRLGLIKH